MLLSAMTIALRGGQNKMMLSFTLTSIQFYMTHWEEYWTGLLLMGKWVKFL